MTKEGVSFNVSIYVLKYSHNFHFQIGNSLLVYKKCPQIFQKCPQNRFERFTVFLMSVTGLNLQAWSTQCKKYEFSGLVFKCVVKLEKVYFLVNFPRWGGGIALKWKFIKMNLALECNSKQRAQYSRANLYIWKERWI